MAPYQTHELRIVLTPDDMPEDRFSAHVNNARYFAFINRTFQAWYLPMGIRGGIPGFTTMMAHLSYDFLREVHVPGTVVCRIRVEKVGRTSMEHAIEMWDAGTPELRLAGRGKAVHVWVNRETGRACPWPDTILARCWTAPPDTPTPA